MYPPVVNRFHTALLRRSPGSATDTPIIWQPIDTIVPSGIRRSRADFGSGSARTATYEPEPFTVARSGLTVVVVPAPAIVVPVALACFTVVTGLRTTFFFTVFRTGEVIRGMVLSGGTVAAVGGAACSVSPALPLPKAAPSFRANTTIQSATAVATTRLGTNVRDRMSLS